MSRSSVPYVTASSSFSQADLTKPSTSYTYNALDRVLTETTPLGITAYSYNGWTVTITDPQNHVKDITRDAFGNVTPIVPAEHPERDRYISLETYRPPASFMG